MYWLCAQETRSFKKSAKKRLIFHKYVWSVPERLTLSDEFYYDNFISLLLRLGEQLLRIVFYNPSWYVQVCLDVQSRKRQHFFRWVSN